MNLQVGVWNKETLKPLLLPGGALLAIAALVLEGELFPLSPPAVDLYYYGVFAAGVLLAWRFHSSRILFALLTLFLAHRAVEFFSAGRVLPMGPGRIALEATTFLVPLNFIVLSLTRERGVAIPGISSRSVMLFLEAVFVAVICRPGENSGPAWLHPAFLGKHWLHLGVPPLEVLSFTVAAGFLLARFLLYRKPMDGGLFWSLAAMFFALHKGGVGAEATAYTATAALILGSSIIENSYVLAYHDELTALPARRAFNEALLHLETPYTIAMVDIDHFKSFNDTYGHETGDQVLCMVAAKQARITGGGQAFRVGGEEFALLFSGKSQIETVQHLELLRMTIQDTTFHVRGGQERRSVSHGTDRRRPARGRPYRSRNVPVEIVRELSVTVSIGVAEPTSKAHEPEQVLRAADKALYRAKHAGRNQVALATAPRIRPARRTA